MDHSEPQPANLDGGSTTAQQVLVVAGAVLAGLGLQFVVSFKTNAAGDADSAAKNGDGEASSGSTALRVRSDLHVRRKVQHAATALLFAVLEPHVAPGLGWVALAIGAAAILAVHRVRLSVPAVNRAYMAALGPIMRTHEADSLPGAFWFVLGSAVVMACTPRVVAMVAILHLGFGDPAASTAGVLLGGRCGRITKGKSVAGTMAALVVCSVTTFVYLWAKGHGERLVLPAGLLLCLASGVVGALAEALDIGVDDNLSIPIISGAALYGMMTFMEVPLDSM